MKLIIAGCRHYTPTVNDISWLIEMNVGIKNITKVISGGARGVDTQGEKWAESQGLPYVRFVPGWGLHGRRYAAYVRNMDMAWFGDECLAIWDGKSPGTKHMIEAMKGLNKPCHVIIW